MTDTLSARKPLRFWGWGYADEELSPEEVKLLDGMCRLLLPRGWQQVEPPTLEEMNLPEVRLPVPDALREILSASRYDRLVHTYGKSYADMLRMFLRDATNAPDLVAFPRNEKDIQALFHFAAQNDAAVVPFGGGTSVCGGVEGDVGEHYAGVISLDMQHFNRVLEVDALSRTATVEAGIFGPELEEALRPHGLTLRHYPQSFVFSTLGGWIATRSGGHFATLYTHIDDLVASIRMLTPQGVIESRRLPGSGAGPSADRLMLGSEGTLGVITRATVRLQHRPRWRAGCSVRFTNLTSAVDAVRGIAQAGLYPSNCRVLDEHEVMLNRVAPEHCALLVLGFESADHAVRPWLDRALEIVADAGGRWQPDAISEQGPDSQQHKQDSSTASWRNSFIRMPYYRNLLAGRGIIADTFETAIPWDRFADFYKGVMAGLQAAIREATGQEGAVSCRFTHVYPDGPAPYFTFYAVGGADGDLQRCLDAWRVIKHAANRLVVELGGTVTHHHAVGRDHREGYEQQTSPLFRQALATAKQSMDPQALLNPGVLFDPVGKPLGIRGVLGEG